MNRLNSFNLNTLRNREWYHQRFDGSPMFIWFIADADFFPDNRKPNGTEPKIRVCFFDPGKADWYLDMADVNTGANAIVKLARKDPKISTKLLASWKTDERKFEYFFLKEFPKIKLDKLNDGELLKLWKKFWLLSIKRLTSSTVIDHFALGTDELIGRMLRKELKKFWKTETDFTKLFSIATAPVHQSFINLAEIDLLKIILGQSKENLASYQKRYFWSKNNYYQAQVLPVEHFQREIKAWKSSKKDLDEELRRLADTPIQSKLLKQQLFKKHPISSLLHTLIKVSEDFTWWQDERKKATYFNIHIGSQILKEIGKRIGFTLEEIKYALPAEIESLMKYKSPNRKELRQRRVSSVFVQTHDEYFVSTTEVEKIRKILLGENKSKNIMDFRGLSASTGRAIGRVRIVKSATEVNKVKQGDILVAVMTRPDYVVAMKKAAAIVTNEGGITSHAAIVSRELGIPCIIGTKIATEVLKDGDLVEVNANHGWVRKIR